MKTRHYWRISIWWTLKETEKSLISQRSGTQYVAIITKILSSYCGAPRLESNCKESKNSDVHWLTYPRLSYCQPQSNVSISCICSNNYILTNKFKDVAICYQGLSNIKGRRICYVCNMFSFLLFSLLFFIFDRLKLGLTGQGTSA